MLAIMKKELRTYFTTMTGWIVLFLFFIISGAAFALTAMTDVADLQPVLNLMFISAMIVAPIITMRLLSEEKNNKTDQLLLTSPVKLSNIVLGKYFSALIIMAIAITIALVYGIIISSKADFSWLTYMFSTLGLFLAGAAFVSIGLFMSSITESQIIALICSFGAMVFLFMLSFLNSAITTPWLKTAVSSISFFDRYTSFGAGMLNISDALFFISVSVVFNFLTVRILEKKRWS